MPAGAYRRMWNPNQRKLAARLLEAAASMDWASAVRPDARFLSLLVAHEGDVPAAVWDIAFFHLVRLIANPDLILPSALRHQKM
jgi:hypothetical protein